MRLMVVAAVPLVLVGAAAAQADCASTQNDFDDVYCLAKTYIDADNDLNAAYKALVTKLDTGGKAALKQGQLAWIKFRNEDCGRSDSDGYYVSLSCAIDTTSDRTTFLRERQAECDAGACDLAALTKVDRHLDE